MLKANHTIQANKDYLSELDRAIGDGDHGINMARGFAEVQNKISRELNQDIGALCQNIAMTLLSKVGGASGPLYGTAFIKMASVFKGKEKVSLDEFSKALHEAVNGIKMRGKAAPGEKTLLDVWEPVSSYVAEYVADLSWQSLKSFAYQQMENTRPLEAKKGRASYLGPRSAGHLDPGAVSSYYLFEALCLTMLKGEKGT
ncbi:dihydroxyacetone kinase subunit L [Paenactinomyces guangxiensis]|uniref:phosphoenolpyruvate--glycerone phosphotransferase n=2 Tax=Paenactinomyces guangxiensis TaxID=1490290 RepID=A0A7W2A8Z4_9BACL|nr:dihydroxyacetone kinase subunit DhaL [Paenactinomyces guangxiensis]MBA4494672.1 dihydroxyacetone kinase subunit L [Paenactinomyces guangxiensis]MBH8591756.1 dihydroxyacetone kinase subunit L [Paenactinomyces guangxiensis]